MEKHYDLIVSLIKAHRKYPECESILDEIVADVYSHAEVVLNTVRNETVIASYLSKIVSTSMVTVPKRLGIVKSRRINFVSDKTADTIETISPEPTTITTEPIIKNDNIEFEREESDTISFNDNEDLQSDTEDILQIDDLENSANDSFKTEKTEKEVDKTLVDKMINGISETDTDFTVIEEPSETVDIDSIDSLEVVDIENEESLESPESFESEEIEPVNTETEQEEYLDLDSDEQTDMNEIQDEDEDNQEEDDNEPIESIDLNESEELISEESELTESTDLSEPEELISEEPELTESTDLSESEELISEEPELTESMETEMLEPIEELEPIESLQAETEELDETVDLDIESNELEQVNDLGVEPEILDEPLVSDDEETVLDINEPTNDILLEGDDNLPEDKPSISNQVENVLAQYKAFDFNPGSDLITEDINEYVNELKLLSSKHQESYIIEVCKLKYKDGLSVSEISQKLNYTQEQVLDILNDIVNIVKD